MLALTPLVGPECRWAVARLWVFVLRCVVALVVLCVALVASWYCWFAQVLDPGFLPGAMLRGSLKSVVGLTLTFVLLLSPAVLAGAFAGGSNWGALGILLSSRVSTGEIVLSRFISRLCQVGIVAAAGLPGVLLLAGYCGINWRQLAVLLLLTSAVASGSGGISLGNSVLFTRARDVLIGTYVVVLTIVFLPILGSYWAPTPIVPWLEALNPFWGLGSLIEYGNLGTAWKSSLLWTAMALLGGLTTSCSLRSAYMRRTGAESKRARRRRHVPPLGDCPIRWKELYIESDKDFGRIVRVISQLVLLLMLGGSTLLVALFFWSYWDNGSPEIVDYTLTVAGIWIKTISLPLGWIVQCAVGIRAAAGIADEKERGTWDALMMTPLDGSQIVRAKMMESFYSLRWFLAAALIVWFLGAALKSIDFYEAALLTLRTIIYVGFVSAVGVWCSLLARTSGRAVTLTLAIWLLGKLVFNVAAVLLVLAAMLLYYLIWAAVRLAVGTTTGAFPQSIISFETAMTIFHFALCIATTIAISWYSHARFDQLAGRRPERPILLQAAPR